MKRAGKPNLRVDAGLIRKLYTWFIPRPANTFARVYSDETENLIPDSSWTTVEFDTERWDTGANSSYANGFWDSGTPTRLTAPVSGNYIITGHVEFASGEIADGSERGIRIRHARSAAVTTIAWHSHPPVPAGQSSATTRMSIATAFWMRAGDYVILQVYQDSGGALTINALEAYSPEFTISRVP